MKVAEFTTIFGMVLMVIIIFFQGKVEDNKELYQERQFLEETMAISMDRCRTGFLCLGGEWVCDVKGAYLNLIDALKVYLGNGKNAEEIKREIICFFVFDNDKVSFVDESKCIERNYEITTEDSKYSIFYDLRGNITVKRKNGYFEFADRLDEIYFNAFSENDREIRELASFYIQDIKELFYDADNNYQDEVVKNKEKLYDIFLKNTIFAYRSLLVEVYGKEILNKYENEFNYFEKNLKDNAFIYAQRPFIMLVFDGKVMIMDNSSGEEMVNVSFLQV